MAINFPDDPELNQQYIINSKAWIWDGSKWLALGQIGYTGSRGVSGGFAGSRTEVATVTMF